TCAIARSHRSEATEPATSDPPGRPRARTARKRIAAMPAASSGVVIRFEWPWIKGFQIVARGGRDSLKRKKYNHESRSPPRAAGSIAKGAFTATVTARNAP